MMMQRTMRTALLAVVMMTGAQTMQAVGELQDVLVGAAIGVGARLASYAAKTQGQMSSQSAVVGGGFIATLGTLAYQAKVQDGSVSRFFLTMAAAAVTYTASMYMVRSPEEAPKAEKPAA